MALLSSCLCCNLLLGAIISGVYATMVYLAAFIISIWWIVESESDTQQEGSVPAPAYLLCLCYLVVSVASAWMLVGLYKKRTRALLVWVFLMTLFCFPEMGMVAFMAFIHWKITSPYGLADLIFYVFRVTLNVLSVLCVQSQYSTWRDAASTSHTLKRLQHLHLNNMGKTYSTTGGGGGRERDGGSDLTMAYHNPAFLGGQDVSPTPLPAAPRPLLTRSLSRASSLPGWNQEMNAASYSTPSNAPLQVRMGLPGWDPYLNRESASEFNAATFSPASVGFMPLVGGGGGGGMSGARSELGLYSSSPSSPTPPSNLTVYHHNPPTYNLYPLQLPHHGPNLHMLPLNGGGGDNFSYAAATQSLDRRRYVRRWQGVGVGGSGGGVIGGASSKSSLGGESDDLRRYRDVAL